MTIEERVAAACQQLLGQGHKLHGKTTAVTCEHDKDCPMAVRPAPCICTPRITFHLAGGAYRVDAQGNVSKPASVK